MPDIYSEQWNKALLDLANSREDLAKKDTKAQIYPRTRCT